MATNRDLLKEAIADAKAVKETAIANAKAALEEAFTPYLREKLSAKLAEMEEVDEKFELREDEVSEVEKEMKEMKKKEEDIEEVSLDELLAELEDDSMEENVEETYMDEDVYEAKGEEEMNIEDMSEDDLKSFIEDVIKDMVSAGELEAGEAAEGEGEESEEMEMGDEEVGVEMDDEELDEEIDEDIDITELLAELDEMSMDEAEDIEELTASQSGAGVSGDNEAIKKVADFLDKSVDFIKKNFNSEELKKTLANIGKAAGSAIRKEEIEELRSELNEVNLLNAKLLYTNKIFRNKSLSESQKVKVLTSFDKATSKKEVELVYETLMESLKVSTMTKAPIKESLGSASKALGGVTSKPIIENDAFARMRELAFGGKK